MLLLLSSPAAELTKQSAKRPKQTDSLPLLALKVVEASFLAAAPLKEDSFFKKEERERRERER